MARQLYYHLPARRILSAASAAFIGYFRRN